MNVEVLWKAHMRVSCGRWTEAKVYSEFVQEHAERERGADVGPVQVTEIDNDAFQMQLQLDY